jgi:NAD(P)-dependent dehydrogenase (short-subunit alcohol dehydrogenase family)
MQGKVAVITGGGSGIGAATAALFVQEGARVVVVGRNEEKLRKTMQDINHENLSYTVADVSQAEDTQRYIRETVERNGGLDIVVSNAGIQGERSNAGVERTARSTPRPPLCDCYCTVTWSEYWV